MRRMHVVFLVLSFFTAVALAARVAAQGEPPMPPPAQPTKPKKLKRVISAIELATSKKEKFSGHVTLKITSGHDGIDLRYHWGGKCKGTKVTDQRLELMMRAMKEGYAVEIPSFPVKYKKRIYNCMKAVRVINE